MDLRNSIMEEVILKNYKLLQFVEKEMNQIKDEIKLVKEENAQLKEEMNQIKDDNIKLIEENKINKNLFCNRQNIQDTFENTMIIGYNIYKQPISWNIEKAYLLQSFKELTELINFFPFGQYIMSVKVFKHLNKFNNFKTFTIDNNTHNKFIDEKFNGILLHAPDNVTSPDIKNGMYLNLSGEVKGEYIKLVGKFYHKQNLKKLLNILDECNIKLIIQYVGCDEIRRDVYPDGILRELINL